MTAFPTITADTPVNDAETLDAIVNDLDERWRAAGPPGGISSLSVWSGAGTVLDSTFWSTLQDIAALLVPYYLNSYAYPEGFAGEAALEFFALSSEDWLAATGLSHSSPRRIRARGPCSLTYDEEADTTTIIDSGAAPGFVAGHVGHRVDVFGVGQFVVATVEDASTITVEGNAAQGHPDTVVSILPDSPVDQDDAAFEHGPCDVGDVLGPWLLYDLIAVLKAMKFTATESVGFTNGESQYGAGGAVG